MWKKGWADSTKWQWNANTKKWTDINGLNYDGMIVEIIYELISVSDTSSVLSQEFLVWARRIWAQRAKNAVLDNLKENKFDAAKS